MKGDPRIHVEPPEILLSFLELETARHRTRGIKGAPFIPRLTDSSSMTA